jgi:NADH-quinone oxidoreductase subunit H
LVAVLIKFHAPPFLALLLLTLYAFGAGVLLFFLAYLLAKLEGDEAVLSPYEWKSLLKLPKTATVGLAISTASLFVAAILVPIGKWVGTNLNVSIIIVFGLLTLALFGKIVVGLSLEGPRGLLGASRNLLIVASYEVPMALAGGVPVLLSGYMSFYECVEAQRKLPFAVVSFVGLLVFVISGMFLANREPFRVSDTPDVRGGYMSLVKGPFRRASRLLDYAFLVVMSFMANALFLGGPYTFSLNSTALSWVKFGAVLFFVMSARRFFANVGPRRTLEFSWLVLTPVGLINFLITSYLIGVVA